MKAYVIGSSALHFWRHDSQAIHTLRPPITGLLTDCPTRREDIEDLQLEALGFGSTPIRLMVPSPELRLSRSMYKYTVQPQPLPACAFRQFSENICIASPELCLLQSRAAYPRFRLMELAMELCGKYALAPDSPRGYISRNHQLTSIESVRAFLTQLPRMHGRRRLLEICEFISDGSRSPMETREYLLACLPKRHGGYGLPSPVLNAQIELSPEEQRAAKRGHLECDMYWKDQGVIVEYDGHDDHESREDRARDALKRNVLIARGYRVFTITSKQIMDACSFDSIMRDISACIGYRLKSFPADWENRRLFLRRELFASMARYDLRKLNEPSAHKAQMRCYPN